MTTEKSKVSQTRALCRRVKNAGPLLSISYLFGRITGTLDLPTSGRFHDTDKTSAAHTHNGINHLDIYEHYVSGLPRRTCAILEIGVLGGDSLRTWNASLPKARICGIDINPDCKCSHPGRIEIEIGSQGNPEFLKRCFGEETLFDLIIDDGSHVNELTLKSFDALFESRLKPGGLHKIEDLQCSYERLGTDFDVAN
ncbi:MAG: hypothetical protein SNJ52_00340, partial [Verrucomicrobiia bacterium]